MASQSFRSDYPFAFDISEAQDINIVLEAFASHHVCLLRGIFKDLAKVQLEKETIQKLFQAAIEKSRQRNSEQDRLFSIRQQLSAPDLAKLRGCAEESMLNHWFSDNLTPAFLQVTTQLLLGKVRVNLSKTAFRKKSDKDSFLLPFHQDARGPTTIYPLVLTCWIPFCEVGRTRPSLEVIARPHEIVLKDNEDANGYRGPEDRIKGPGDDWVLKTFGEFLYAPEMQLGDCLLFSGDVLHRSQPLDHAGDRISVDMRLFSESQKPQKFQGDLCVDLNQTSGHDC